MTTRYVWLYFILSLQNLIITPHYYYQLKNCEIKHDSLIMIEYKNTDDN